MNTFLSFVELYKDASLFAGTHISVTGTLAVDAEKKSYITSNYEGFLRGERMPILDDTRIANYLLRTMPVTGGGKAIYCIEAFINAKAILVSEHYALSELSLVKVIYEDKEVDVPLGK